MLAEEKAIIDSLGAILDKEAKYTFNKGVLSPREVRGGARTVKNSVMSTRTKEDDQATLTKTKLKRKNRFESTNEMMNASSAATLN